MVRVCQQAGLTLAQIRAALAVLADAVLDGQIPGPQNWELLAQYLRRELDTRIHDLSRLLGALGSACCCVPASSSGSTASWLTFSAGAVARSGCCRTWKRRTRSCCRWTPRAPGSGITTCSPACCSSSCAAPSPVQ